MVSKHTKNRQTGTKNGPQTLKMDQIWSERGQKGPTRTKNGPNVVRVGPKMDLQALKMGQVWSESDQKGPTRTKNGPNVSEWDQKWIYKP